MEKSSKKSERQDPQFLEWSYIYAPYVPLQVTSVFMTEKEFNDLAAWGGDDGFWHELEEKCDESHQRNQGNDT